eukprot:CAMPEP_0185710538 /NCGR_PEP_ID=MMETSP1164-20130828/30938_1 /TAXON_ID=1104430 /ORGANISM="Chrysoreinhardia sp, Strain CCMP2950" /LENGTH=452 /DNA_ID=CAMNT_0028378055 /DNA_START=46 /DNA_END=1403 /DNA_ORIENTATION=+
MFTTQTMCSRGRSNKIRETRDRADHVPAEHGCRVLDEGPPPSPPRRRGTPTAALKRGRGSPNQSIAQTDGRRQNSEGTTRHATRPDETAPWSRLFGDRRRRPDSRGRAFPIHLRGTYLTTIGAASAGAAARAVGRASPRRPAGAAELDVDDVRAAVSRGGFAGGGGLAARGAGQRGGEVAEELLDVEARLGGGLDEHDVLVVGLGLALLARDLAPVREVRLVADEHDDDVVAALGADVVDPLGRVDVRGAVRRVVHDDGDRAVADVRRDEAAEPLLAGGVPQLEPHGAVLEVHRFGEKVDADRRLIALVEAIVHEPVDDARLADALVAEEDEFDLASGAGPPLDGARANVDGAGVPPLAPSAEEDGAAAFVSAIAAVASRRATKRRGCRDDDDGSLPPRCRPELWPARRRVLAEAGAPFLSPPLSQRSTDRRRQRRGLDGDRDPDTPLAAAA